MRKGEAVENITSFQKARGECNESRGFIQISLLFSHVWHLLFTLN